MKSIELEAHPDTDLSKSHKFALVAPQLSFPTICAIQLQSQLRANKDEGERLKPLYFSSTEKKIWY